MKASIHPDYKAITVTCSCGNSFETYSTRCADLSIEICAQCHPFYTGKKRLDDNRGQVQKFHNRYKSFNKKSSDQEND